MISSIFRSLQNSSKVSFASRNKYKKFSSDFFDELALGSVHVSDSSRKRWKLGCVVAVLKFIDPEVAFFVRIGARLTLA